MVALVRVHLQEADVAEEEEKEGVEDEAPVRQQRRQLNAGVVEGKRRAVIRLFILLSIFASLYIIIDDILITH